MENGTAQSIAERVASLKGMLSQVSTAIDHYAEIATKNVGARSIAQSGEIAEAHTALFMETNKLLRGVRGPLDMVFTHFENSAYSGTLRAIMEMGVFEALPLDGTPVTATVLAENLGVEKDLLVRLMRVLTISGPFAETGLEEYSHTEYSKIYLVPELQGILKLMFDEFGPVNAKLYEFFRVNGFKSPNDQVINPYCYAHKTGGKTMWEHVATSPDRMKNFNMGMVAQTEATGWTVGIFPFESELKTMKTDDKTVLLVDIGGGKGHVTKKIQILTAAIPGQIILQERPEVLCEIQDLLPGITTMEYDFFTPQPIKGALIYYIRRCLHDWTDDDCVRILTQIAGAMERGLSRLLISEVVLPAMNADVEAGWMDLTMLAVGGRERTEGEWAKLLDLSGLKLEKTFHAPGTNYGAIEAYLK